MIRTVALIFIVLAPGAALLAAYGLDMNALDVVFDGALAAAMAIVVMMA